MSILNKLLSSYGDDIARAAGNKIDDVARIAANKSDDVARIAANNADNASTALGRLLSPEQESYFKNSVMRDADGAFNSLGNSADDVITRIGSKNVAPIDRATLPESLQAAQNYLDESEFIRDIEAFTGKKYPKITDQDFIEYSLELKKPADREFYKDVIKDLVDDGSTTYEKYAASSARNDRLNKLRMGGFTDVDPKTFSSYIANHRAALSDGKIKNIDAELSDRLGIGRSNTLMRDNDLPQDALGVYNPMNTTLSVNVDLPEENAINTLAHERLHSFQTESDFKRYDKRVTDAYDELSKDLNKYLKTPEETAKRYKFDADYWGDEREQQSRMLQQYLENKGFTKNGLQEANVGEWGNEINPAFDKFFDELRTLSKQGVALPAVGGILGGGSILGALLGGDNGERRA